VPAIYNIVPHVSRRAVFKKETRAHARSILINMRLQTSKACTPPFLFARNYFLFILSYKLRLSHLSARLLPRLASRKIFSNLSAEMRNEKCFLRFTLDPKTIKSHDLEYNSGFFFPHLPIAGKSCRAIPAPRRILAALASAGKGLRELERIVADNCSSRFSPPA